MPYVGGGNADKKLQELREKQASRRSEVTAANKREEVKLTAFLDKLDSKHDKAMVNLNTKLHVTKIDLVREIQREASPRLLQQVQKASKHVDSQAHSSFQPKNMKFGAMKVPSHQFRQRHNISPISKIYPFHLIKAGNIEVSKIARKKQLPSISPKQFPVLAAKYYRESQIKSDKMQVKARDNVLESATIQKLVKGIRDTSPKKQNGTAVENGSLPPVSVPLQSNLHHTFPPPNSPRIRPILSEIALLGKSKTNDPSDEDLQRLRNGQYFLRYSTAPSTDSNHDADNKTESDVATSDGNALSKTTVCPHTPREKARFNDVLTLVEDYNKPKET